MSDAELNFEEPEPAAVVQDAAAPVAPEAETDPLKREVQLITTRAKELVISTPALYEAAAEALKTIKDYQKGVKEKLTPFVDAAKKTVDDAKAGLDKAKAEVAKYIDPSTEAENILKTKMLDYVKEENRKKEAERIRLQAEADKKAEDDKLAKAQALQDVGLNAAADAVLEAPAAAPPVKMAPVAPKVAGVYTQERWSAQVVDLMALVKAVAEGKVPLMFLKADEVALNKQAVLLKKEFNFPGVIATPETKLATR